MSDTIDEVKTPLVFGKPPEGVTNGKRKTGRTSFIKEHKKEVRLPDGRTAQCRYERYAKESQGLTYTIHEDKALGIAGFSQYVRVGKPDLGKSLAQIEEAMKTHAVTAFEKAQGREVEKATRKTPEYGEKKIPAKDDTPWLTVAIADKFAGKYAACKQTRSGKLLRLGYIRETAAEAQADLVKFPSANCVGICHRLKREWIVPDLLAAMDMDEDVPAAGVESTAKEEEEVV